MNKKTKLLIIAPVILAIAAIAVIIFKAQKPSGKIYQEISPVLGAIQNVVSTTGTVLPKNRLQIKPPVNGRVESILVKEGEKVKAGQILAWMSSNERAALLDAARGQGEKELAYWQQVYKPIALLASIDAEVIVATTQPGQTVSTTDAVIVLSDHLIVRAQVDETDIGKVKLGQNAIVSLDAYPDAKIKAAVEHIYYESKTVNNVTIYEVDLLPEEIPVFFRSGMNVTIDFITNYKENALLLPLEAVHKEKEENFVLLKANGAKEPVKRTVKLGIADDKNVEITLGVDINDKIVIQTKKYSLPKSNTGSNPFMPFGQRRRSN